MVCMKTWVPMAERRLVNGVLGSQKAGDSTEVWPRDTWATVICPKQGNFSIEQSGPVCGSQGNQERKRAISCHLSCFGA